MRDILVTVVIFGALPFALWRPQIGVLLFVWISVMNPHRLTWSFAYTVNFAAIVAVVTIASALISRELKRPPMNALTITLLLFGAWTTVTTAFALYPEPSFEMWKTFIKTQTMVLLIFMLFQDKKHLRLLIWVIVLSIAYYGVKGGIWILSTGGENRVWGPPGSYIEDNNAIAVAIVMTIPLMRYLQTTATRSYVRWALGMMMVFCAVAVLGSYSRGALLAVVAMGMFLSWKTRNKLVVLAVLVVAVPAALSFMPDRWYARMETIATYEEDMSATMRLNAWHTMLNLANDRPIFGGGFDVAETEVFAKYSPNSQFRPQVAHSIYLQALGEHGYVGLVLYLLLLCTLWWQAAKLKRLVKGDARLAWAEDFALMMQVAFIGFMVGGAFLSLVNFDVPYYLIAALASTIVVVERELTASYSDSHALREPLTRRFLSGKPTLAAQPKH